MLTKQRAYEASESMERGAARQKAMRAALEWQAQAEQEEEEEFAAHAETDAETDGKGAIEVWDAEGEQSPRGVFAALGLCD